MKLRLVHLLIIVLGVLVLGNLGFSIKENLEMRKKNIPKCDSDLYILKSEIVPPVCPKCPDVCPKKAKCPPCPPCGRCPSAPFKCKSVPNYDMENIGMDGSDLLPSPLAMSTDPKNGGPRPLLTDFSSFV